jgi:hypothetical protein
MRRNRESNEAADNCPKANVLCVIERSPLYLSIATLSYALSCPIFAAIVELASCLRPPLSQGPSLYVKNPINAWISLWGYLLIFGALDIVSGADRPFVPKVQYTADTWYLEHISDTYLM